MVLDVIGQADEIVQVPVDARAMKYFLDTQEAEYGFPYLERKPFHRMRGRATAAHRGQNEAGLGLQSRTLLTDIFG